MNKFTIQLHSICISQEFYIGCVHPIHVLSSPEETRKQLGMRPKGSSWPDGEEARLSSERLPEHSMHPSAGPRLGIFNAPNSEESPVLAAPPNLAQVSTSVSGSCTSSPSSGVGKYFLTTTFEAIADIVHFSTCQNKTVLHAKLSCWSCSVILKECDKPLLF